MIDAAFALARREVVRFLRQRTRVVGAFAQPVLFWILFGLGIRNSFRFGGDGPDAGMAFDEYFFPGIVVLIALFTAIFATISVIEDRKEGFLQGVLVAPVPRAAVVLGKVLGGTALTLVQVWLFLLLAPLAGVPLSPTTFVLVTLHMTVVAAGMTCLGLCIAWPMTSTQGFHAVMSVFLLPLWLLSGAFFPADGAAPVLAWIIRLNPVSYAVAGLRRLLYWHEPQVLAGTEVPGLVLGEVVTVVATLVMFAAAVRVASGREKAS